MNSGVILVIDDEVQIQKLLEITLQSNNYAVHLASNAKEGLLIAANHPPDLIVLDLGLPDENGHDLLMKLREWYMKPIIILSVQSSEEDIVRALDNGANDYLVKPFRTGEFLARIRTAIRSSVSEENDPVLEFKDLTIDMSSRVVKKNDLPVKLTATEYNLLVLLAKNKGKVLIHNYILRIIWGPGYIHQSQYLRVFIAQIRKKIEEDPNHPEYIITEPGIGYRFVDRE